MTLWRWSRSGRVRFLQPTLIVNNRRFWSAGSIRRWLVEQASVGPPHVSSGGYRPPPLPLGSPGTADNPDFDGETMDDRRFKPGEPGRDAPVSRQRAGTPENRKHPLTGPQGMPEENIEKHSTR